MRSLPRGREAPLRRSSVPRGLPPEQRGTSVLEARAARAVLPLAIAFSTLVVVDEALGQTAEDELATTDRARSPLGLRVGLLTGEPLGATAALQLAPRFVVGADVGPSTSEDSRAVAAIDLTYWMPEVFGSVGAGGFMAPWFGIGARAAMGRDGDPDRFGFRVPFGVSYVGREGPIELFVAVSPGLALVPSRRATLDGGLGIRVGL